MRTTISIDEQMMDELMEQENFKSRSEGVRRAIEFFLRQRKMERFKRLAGSHLIDLHWKTIEKLDLEESNQSD